MWEDSPESVTESDGTSVHIELLSRNVENFLVGDGDGRESFVDLEFGNLINRDTCSLESQRDSSCGSYGEINRCASGIGEG